MTLLIKAKQKIKRGKMVSVNQQTCIGCGNCEAVCSKVFQLRDGKSYIKKGQEKSKLPCVKEAIDSCPTNSIRE